MEAKKRKAPVRREGERFMVKLIKTGAAGAVGAKLSFSVSPSATGYTLRARNATLGAGVKIGEEQFSEALHGDSFAAAKKRASELTAAAVAKGWVEKRNRRPIEELF